MEWSRCVVPPSRESCLVSETPVVVDTEAIAQAIAEAAWDTKARNLRVLDVRKVVSYADFLVVCHGTSERHARSIAEYVVDDLRDAGLRPIGVEGLRESNWILVDYGDVVLHVFHEPFRQEYAIESIYADAPRVTLEPPGELEESEQLPS